MALLNALDDFVQRSLDRLPTVWEKLRFVRDLRTDRNQYLHWGMERKFGAEETQAAIAQAHSSLCEELTSTGFPELWNDAERAASREQAGLEPFLAPLQSPLAAPAEWNGVLPEHFEYVITHFAKLGRFRSQSTQQAA